MTERSPISVVILTWNDGKVLELALRSALSSESVDVEVVVVDNGSEPPAVVDDDQRVQLIRSAINLGVSKGRNLAVRSSTGRLVCFLDSDAELEPRTLATLADAVESAPDIALAGPVFRDQEPEESGGRAPTLTRKLARLLGRTTLYEQVDRSGGERWDVDFVIGACQLFRRDAFDAVGGLDERWFYGPEDVDFCLRLRERGARIVQCGDARCRHPPRRRNRKILTVRGVRHAFAVSGFLWRHRRFQRRLLP
jgi:GT2 family glycosyltransferase